MRFRFHWMLLTGLALSCHSGAPSGAGSPYDSTTVTPGGKDSLSNRAPQDVDSIEAQIHAPDSIFEDGSVPTSWRNAGFTDPVRFKRFLLLFKDWVKADQMDSITDHIRFPIRGAGSAAWFKEQYHLFFTPRMKAVVGRQRLDRIFRNGQGAMLGNGDIWFVENHGKYWISAVN